MAIGACPGSWFAGVDGWELPDGAVGGM